MTDNVLSRILPVLDLKDGGVVRGVGGRRDEYRPIVSQLTSSNMAVDVARALSERFGFREFYVADLGAICEGIPHWSDINVLSELGFGLSVDSGIHDANSCAALLKRTGLRAVLGLETIATVAAFREIVQSAGRERLVFSLDLLNGRPMCDEGQWPADPMEIARVAVESGLQSLIVLDLGAVGVGAGCPTLPLCTALRARWPHLEIVTGGGVRSREDVEAALTAGADRVLVASALHDGRIG